MIFYFWIDLFGGIIPITPNSNAKWVYQSGVAVNAMTHDVIYWVEAFATGIPTSAAVK